MNRRDLEAQMTRELRELQKRIKEAEKKSVEFIELNATKAKELNAKESRIAEINSEIGIKEKHLEDLNRLLGQTSKAIDDHKDVHASWSNRIIGTQTEANEAAKELESLRIETSGIRGQIALAESNLLEISNLLSSRKNELIQLTEQAETLNNELVTLRETIRTERELAADEAKSLQARRDDLQELVVREEQVATQITNDLGKLELYVKRLQRYYDQSGIQIDVLKEFNIPKRIHPQHVQ